MKSREFVVFQSPTHIPLLRRCLPFSAFKPNVTIALQAQNSGCYFSIITPLYTFYQKRNQIYNHNIYAEIFRNNISMEKMKLTLPAQIEDLAHPTSQGSNTLEKNQTSRLSSGKKEDMETPNWELRTPLGLAVSLRCVSAKDRKLFFF